MGTSLAKHVALGGHFGGEGLCCRVEQAIQPH